MDNKILYWIYLEPYTFLFEGKESWVVYNTVNSAYLLCEDYVIVELLKKLSNIDNGYIIPIDRKLARKKPVIDFIRNIRNTFSGDVVSDKCIKKGGKPFIFMPILRLYNNIDRIKKERGKSLGELILRNLSEVTLFLSTDCSFNCKYCDLYKKQFIHCSKNVSMNDFSHNQYLELFERLGTCGVSRVNFVLSDFSDEKIDLLRMSLLYSFKRNIYVDIRNIDGRILDILNELNVVVHVTISFCDLPFKDIRKKVMRYKDYKISWECIVANEEELILMDEFSFLENIKMVPFYTGYNVNFFKNYVFLSLDDILSNKIKKQQIYRRQVLNENFFGKLYILPSGEVYTNMNLSPIGNIKENSLGEIVYREFDDSKSWLMIRNGEKCGNCVNRFLCPSISNYELVIGEENLCHIYKC